MVGLPKAQKNKPVFFKFIYFKMFFFKQKIFFDLLSLNLGKKIFFIENLSKLIELNF